MKRKRRSAHPAPETPVELEVTWLDEHGQGVGQWEARTVAIHGALPGDRVRASITWASATTPWARARLIDVIRPSGERVPPTCPHGPGCVGCPLSLLSYDAQLREKRDRLLRALKESGLLADVDPIVPAPTTSGYRSRAKFVVERREGKVLFGAYRQGTHDVQETDACQVADPNLNRTIASLHTAMSDADDGGLMRHVVIRSNRRGDVLGTLVVQRAGTHEIARLAEKWRAEAPALIGVVEHHQGGEGDAILSHEGAAERLLTGTASFPERIAGVDVEVPATAFTQLHPQAAELLYAHVATLLAPLEDRTILDAYCGLGAFAFALRAGKRIVCVDETDSAIRAGTEAAQRARLAHLHFIAGDAARWMEAAAARGEHFDDVIVDPPRKGLSSEGLETLVRLDPERIVYVACEPRSLARDAARLLEHGYWLARVTPFDLFPHTAEVETAALLVRA